MQGSEGQGSALDESDYDDDEEICAAFDADRAFDADDELGAFASVAPAAGLPATTPVAPLFGGAGASGRPTPAPAAAAAAAPAPGKATYTRARSGTKRKK